MLYSEVFDNNEFGTVCIARFRSRPGKTGSFTTTSPPGELLQEQSQGRHLELAVA